MFIHIPVVDHIRPNLETSCFCTVGAQKFAGIRLVKSSRWQSSGFSANALGTRMNLFERFARVIKV